MSIDIKQLRADVAGFNGRFFYDAEHGDIAYIARECDEKQCECPRRPNPDGDQDCSVSINDFDEAVFEPIARVLNSTRAALARIAELERLVVEACELGEEANGDPSSCSHIVPVGERLAEIRAAIEGKATP